MMPHCRKLNGDASFYGGESGNLRRVWRSNVLSCVIPSHERGQAREKLMGESGRLGDLL